MNDASESVVIEDDDDDVQIVDDSSGAYGNNPSSVGDLDGKTSNPDLGQKKPQNVRIANQRYAKNMPPEIKGFSKPSYNYSRLITQALASVPERRATALQICDIIAKKHPYYEHLTNIINWRASIYAALRTRKKFFTITGTDLNNEIIWSFNPTFEQFMLDKWVPKYVQKKSLSSSIKNYIPWLPKNHPQQFNPYASKECSMTMTSASTNSTAVSSESRNPVIVYSGTLVSSSPLSSSVVNCDSSSADSVTNESLEKDPLEPEVTLLDPVIQSVSAAQDDFKPWEPEVTVNEDTTQPEHTTQPPNSMLSVALQESPSKTKPASSPSSTPKNQDFSLENLNVQHVILKEEIIYRVNFNKEHESVEKFRLHCTVCDDHLGTSGSVCRRKVRLHSYLGVLVCSTCYERTCSTTISGLCLWCAKPNDVRIRCVHCFLEFCQICLERNFGKNWSASMLGRRDWKCFRCDTKQIWPHRAIAYFLFRHYRNIKRKRDQMSRFKNISPKEIRFFIQDLSTCCKPSATKERRQTATVTSPPSDEPVASVTPNVVSPLVTNPVLTPTSNTTSVTSQPPLIVVGEQAPNYIYVQTPSSVPSVTHTQYIQNVYPNKNYLVVGNSTENKSASPVNTPTFPNTILYSQPPSSAPGYPVVIPQKPSQKNISTVTTNNLPPPYSFPSQRPPPPYPTLHVEITPIQESSEESVSNTSIKSKGEAKGIIASKPVVNKTITVIHGYEPEEPIIIPDVDPPEELKTQEEKVIAAPILTPRERIERRPMPKSKKQSLLKTVLMSESIESMKRHMQLQSGHNISTDVNEISASSASPEASRHEGDQNLEEPILKSIIETATERLLSLQRNQNVSSSTSKSVEEARPDVAVSSSSDTCIDLCGNESSSHSSNPCIDLSANEDSSSTSDQCIDLCGNDSTSTQVECKVMEPPITIPKIKIKTLKELQDPEIFNISHSISENHAQTNEERVNIEFANINQQCTVENQEMGNRNMAGEGEINITDLKQGIIEASRTLINTQKKFKELAKIISSNLIYKPDQAIELIRKFHNILKICHQELDEIDGSVKNKFGHLIPNTDINSILQLMKKNKEGASSSEGPVVLKKRKKQKRSLGKIKSNATILQENMEHEMDALGNDETNIQSSIQRKRDLLDFNPLGKKVILGSPEITEEDLRRIPNTWESTSQERLNHNKLTSHNQVYMEELRRRQYLAKKDAWKKKNIWLTTRRRKRKYKQHALQHDPNSPLMYNEHGSLIKKRPYKKRKRMSDSDDEDDDKTYRPNNSQFYPLRRTRRRSSELSRPLRLSARMHPSSAAHVAQVISSEERGLINLIKPCSVVLERLDPMTVLLLTL